MNLTYVVGTLLSLFAVTLAMLVQDEGKPVQTNSSQTPTNVRAQAEGNKDGDFKFPAYERNVRQAGVSLISFDTVGNYVSIGLDYLVPFLEVPVKRKPNAPPKPLVIVNTAAILSGGLVAAGGIAVGHLIRRLGLESRDMENEKESPHTARNMDDKEMTNLMEIFDNFKLIYRNESAGERIATTLPSFFSTMEQTFSSNDINLPICLQKSICALVHEARHKVLNRQTITDLERIIDSATNWSWLLAWLERTQLALHSAIAAGKMATQLSAAAYCDLKYAQCKWSAPAAELRNLIANNVKFI